MRDTHNRYFHYALDLFPSEAHSEIVSGRNQGPAHRRRGKPYMPKIAIVTGACRGIGKAVAERLARDGFAVVVNYASNAKEADATVAEIQSAGGQAIAVKADG